MNLFLNYLQEDPRFFFAWIFVVVFSICLHEYSHAMVALRNGDDTAARAGHLTMNPLRQMGITSLVMLVVIGVAWGAVPVNPYHLRNKLVAARVSFAGPAANLILMVLFSLLYVLMSKFFPEQQMGRSAAYVFKLGMIANGVLFVLNMLPVPMLDGWAVFALVFPPMRRVSPQQVQIISLVAIVLLVATPAWNYVWRAGELLAGLSMSLWGFII